MNTFQLILVPLLAAMTSGLNTQLFFKQSGDNLELNCHAVSNRPGQEQIQHLEGISIFKKGRNWKGQCSKTQWILAAHISRKGNQQAANMLGTTTGHYLSPDIGKTSLLKIQLPAENAGPLDTFRCDAIGLDQSGSVIREKSHEVTPNKDPTKDECSCKHMTDISDKVNKLQQKLNNAKDAITKLAQKIKDVGSGRGRRPNKPLYETWPEGTYALLEPESGCPSDGDWATGYRSMITESSNPFHKSLNKVSSNSRLSMPVFTKFEGKRYAVERFCVKSNNPHGPTWPRGSYCITKKNDCPRGFQRGHVFHDEEDDKRPNVVRNGGNMPDGIFGSNSDIYYCCRKDWAANRPIHLPTGSPFYLYRHGGSCQRVAGMNVRSEYIMLDTEDVFNKDHYEGAHPDGSLDNVKMELCYYSKDTRNTGQYGHGDPDKYGNQGNQGNQGSQGNENYNKFLNEMQG